jgi:hypothetical protein
MQRFRFRFVLNTTRSDQLRAVVVPEKAFNELRNPKVCRGLDKATRRSLFKDIVHIPFALSAFSYVCCMVCSGKSFARLRHGGWTNFVPHGLSHVNWNLSARLQRYWCRFQHDSLARLPRRRRLAWRTVLREQVESWCQRGELWRKRTFHRHLAKKWTWLSAFMTCVQRRKLPCKCHQKTPRALVRPEGLGQSKKIIHLVRSRTRDLPACSIVL